MTRRYLLLGLIPGAARAQPLSIDTSLVARWLNLHHSWFLFLRDYFGCPKDGTQFDITQCRQALGTLDRKRYNTAREHAKAVFQLGERNEH